MTPLEDPRERRLQRQVSEVSASGRSDLELIDEWPDDEARAALEIILEFACCSQHYGSISAGRRTLDRLPSKWLDSNLESTVLKVINLNDEYELRRLLEALKSRPVLRGRIVDLGMQSESREIVEAAREYLETMLGDPSADDHEFPGSARHEPRRTGSAVATGFASQVRGQIAQ